METRRWGLEPWLSSFRRAGFTHFKAPKWRFGGVSQVSRALEGAVGPLGDDATDWRLGLAWRNASGVQGDALQLCPGRKGLVVGEMM